jgi:hypothetical protein
MNIEESKIESAVIEQAVEQLVYRYTSGEESLRGEISKCATEIIKASLDQQVQAALVQGVEAITFPQANKFGENKGPDRTLREYIDGMIQGFLQEQVDSDGRTKDSGYGRSESRIVWLVRKEVEKHVEASVKTAAQAINAQISSTIGAIVKASIDQAVARLK